MADIDAMLTANQTLTEKVKKLEEENKELYSFKEEFLRQCETVRRLERALEVKRKVLKVVGKKDKDCYALMVTKAVDTPDGMYIEVELV